MKSYTINLPSRTDRILEMRIPQALSDTNEIFEATNGSIFSDFGSKRMRGHIGCWDSHRRLMLHIIDAGNGQTLVLEDDCDFTTERKEVFEMYLKELPEDWDLLYLGGVNQDAPESFSEHLDYARNILQTHAYIVRDKFIPILLQTLIDNQWKVDIVFSKAIKEGKCFICNPPIAVQRNSQSDVSGC